MFEHNHTKKDGNNILGIYLFYSYIFVICLSLFILFDVFLNIYFILFIFVCLCLLFALFQGEFVVAVHILVDTLGVPQHLYVLIRRGGGGMEGCGTVGCGSGGCDLVGGSVIIGCGRGGVEVCMCSMVCVVPLWEGILGQ